MFCFGSYFYLHVDTYHVFAVEKVRTTQTLKQVEQSMRELSDNPVQNLVIQLAEYQLKFNLISPRESFRNELDTQTLLVLSQGSSDEPWQRVVFPITGVKPIDNS